MTANSHQLEPAETESLFGPVMSTYTRTQAIEDGVLVDTGQMAQEAGFRLPVALTAGAWVDCVAWSGDDSRRQVHQEESGRLWDVLTMAAYAIRIARGIGDQLLFPLYRVPRDGQTKTARETTLKLLVGPGDNAEPVVTILRPSED